VRAGRPRVDRLLEIAAGPVLLGTTAAATIGVASFTAALTRTTIWLALVEYAAALWLMMPLSAEDWRARAPRGQWTRQLWTWACITFLVHVACAFHFTHGWSQAHALEQTRRESGFGEGLYVNYLFMAAWVADVAWWWIAPAHYAMRSSWIDRGLHAFMLFIAFNATVVFETGLVRWAGVAGSLALLVRWILGRQTT
jgi:hypothetical protein